MQIRELIEKLIIKTENKELHWRDSNTIGRYEVDLKSVTVAIDASFAFQDASYRLIIIDPNGSIKNTYFIPSNNPVFPRAKELYIKIKDYYDDELLKSIIEDM